MIVKGILMENLFAWIIVLLAVMGVGVYFFAWGKEVNLKGYLTDKQARMLGAVLFLTPPLTLAITYFSGISNPLRWTTAVSILTLIRGGIYIRISNWW